MLIHIFNYYINNSINNKFNNNLNYIFKTTSCTKVFFLHSFPFFKLNTDFPNPTFGNIGSMIVTINILKH